MHRRGIACWVLCAGLYTGAGHATPELTICVDQTPWYPLVFSERGEARGVHVDVVRCALDASGFRFRMRPLPWARCLRYVGDGEFDAAATATYTPQRAKTLVYPSDAPTTERSRWAVGYEEDVVITAAGSGFVFEGNPATLPQPIRIPRGWAIGDALRAQGIPFEAGAAGDEGNLRKLARDRTGSVIATSVSVRAALRDLELARRVEVQAVPMQKHSYFLVFSQAGSRLDAAERQRIWEQIARVRDDPQVLSRIESRYADASTDEVTRMRQLTIAPLDCGGAGAVPDSRESVVLPN